MSNSDEPEDLDDARVNFPPVLNGLDYLESTVKLLSGGEDVPPQNLKYAVLHLAAAVETLLKARLALKDPALVWADSSEYNEAKHRTGHFTSCKWGEARKRVLRECAPETTLLAPRYFNALAAMRNRFAHVGVQESALTVEVLTTPVLDNMLDFVRTDLLPLVETDEVTAAEEAMERLRPALGKIRRLVDLRMAPSKESLSKGHISVIACRTCAAFAVPISGDNTTLTCLVCHTGMGTPRDAAWDCAGTSAHEVGQDGGDSPVLSCEHCGEEETVTRVPADTAVSKAEERLLCLFCGVDSVGVCSFCFRAVLSFAIPESEMCSDCVETTLRNF
ncbi:hypothetical protein [Streptomyces cyaneofuscatus]|uniref:hypothetical protein n=1 Tax=Streptomyces griseus group TaxID=629295 RepID=UPI0037B1CE7A